VTQPIENLVGREEGLEALRRAGGEYPPELLAWAFDVALARVVQEQGAVSNAQLAQFALSILDAGERPLQDLKSLEQVRCDAIDAVGSLVTKPPPDGGPNWCSSTGLRTTIHLHPSAQAPVVDHLVHEGSTVDRTCARCGAAFRSVIFSVCRDCQQCLLPGVLAEDGERVVGGRVQAATQSARVAHAASITVVSDRRWAYVLAGQLVAEYAHEMQALIDEGDLSDGASERATQRHAERVAAAILGELR